MPVRLRINKAASLQGTCFLPGDKSISHRALMFGAIAHGRSKITNFLNGSDCLATAKVLASLGIRFEKENPTSLVVEGVGLNGFSAPNAFLNCENSGTTIRLMTGLLSAQGFHSILDGSEQIRNRPMKRVIDPLLKMGACISARDGNNLAPIRIAPPKILFGKTHTLSIASAQVKSALMLAGLYAKESTKIIEPGPSRDHSERLLSAMGARIIRKGQQLEIFSQEQPLSPFEMRVPSDPSSAAFLVAAATVLPHSRICLKRVGTNPTRTGFFDAVLRMGGNISYSNAQTHLNEDVADISVCSSHLTAKTFDGEIIVRMIDEIPILAVLATQAVGTTMIRDAKELKVKETNRIDTTVLELRKMGAAIEPTDDGLIIEGPTPLKGAHVNSHGDHRIAMAMAIAGLYADGETVVENAEVTVDSFPGFAATLRTLGAHLVEESM